MPAPVRTTHGWLRRTSPASRAIALSLLSCETADPVLCGGRSPRAEPIRGLCGPRIDARRYLHVHPAGGTAPLTGPETAYAPVARGAQAYFAYVNAHGGVFKRKINYKVLDDAYDPSKTVQATRQLVQQDGVFAIFNSIGTEHVLAVRQYLNAVGVPQLFVGSGADVIAKQRANTSGRWATSELLGRGRDLRTLYRQTPEGTTIGVLYENSEYGSELLRGLKAGLKGKAPNRRHTDVRSDRCGREDAGGRPQSLRSEDLHDLRPPSRRSSRSSTRTRTAGIPTSSSPRSPSTRSS